MVKPFNRLRNSLNYIAEYTSIN